MLVALNELGHPIIATQSHRGQTARCPECREVLVYKNGPVITTHWAHRPDGDCSHGEGESREHMAMKSYIHEVLTKWGYDVELEVEMLGRRADVVVWDDDNDPIVIECQASPIAPVELKSRMEDYSAQGIPVMWVWSHKRIKHKWNYEYRMPKEVLTLLRMTMEDEIYVATETGPIEAWCLRPAEERSNDFGTYIPKTLKRLSSRWRAIDHATQRPHFAHSKAVGDEAWTPSGVPIFVADVHPEYTSDKADLLEEVA